MTYVPNREVSTLTADDLGRTLTFRTPDGSAAVQGVLLGIAIHHDGENLRAHGGQLLRVVPRSTVQVTLSGPAGTVDLPPDGQVLID